MIAVGDLLVLKSRKKNFAPGWDSNQLQHSPLRGSCWMSPGDVFLVLGFENIDGASYMYLMCPTGSILISLTYYYEQV